MGVSGFISALKITTYSFETLKIVAEVKVNFFCYGKLSVVIITLLGKCKSVTVTLAADTDIVF